MSQFYINSSGGGGNTNIQTITGNSGGAVGPDVSHNINLVGTGGVTVTGNPGTNTLTIGVSGSGFSWNVVTSADNPVTLVAENGYIPKGASVVNFVLPAAAVIGDTYKIAGYGNLWTLSQNAGQSITLGVSSTTTGVAGSLKATQVRDTVEIICVTTNTEFQVLNDVGNITFI